MIQTNIKIEGMMCGMCEAHVNEIIRKHFNITRVSSSHAKGETIVISEYSLDKELLKKAINETGYKLVSYTETTHEHRPKFQLFSRKA